jgi:hypothetical protein
VQFKTGTEPIPKLIPLSQFRWISSVRALWTDLIHRGALKHVRSCDQFNSTITCLRRRFQQFEKGLTLPRHRLAYAPYTVKICPAGFLEEYCKLTEDIEDQRAEELENVERENQLSTLITSEN